MEKLGPGKNNPDPQHWLRHYRYGVNNSHDSIPKLQQDNLRSRRNYCIKARRYPENFNEEQEMRNFIYLGHVAWDLMTTKDRGIRGRNIYSKSCSHRFLHGNLVKGVHAVLHSFRDHAKLVRTNPAQQVGLKGRAPRENLEVFFYGSGPTYIR
jgi:hypothetical protein